jgi:hypothetical protein
LLLTDAHVGAGETVTVTGGLFNVKLGSGDITAGTQSSLTDVFRDSATVFLEIHVEPEKLCPRIRLASAPYSLNADHLDGVDAEQFLRNDTDELDIVSFAPILRLQSTQSQTLASSSIQFGSTESGSWQSAGSVGDPGSSDSLALFGRNAIRFNANFAERMLINSLGNVGIGTLTPSARLDVVGTTELNGNVTVTGGNNLVVGGSISVDEDLTLSDGSVLRAARPDPPCFDDSNRFVDCLNGTVTDTVTGLTWLQDADCPALGGAQPWASANQAAVGLSDGTCGLTDNSSAGDWRVPTKEEWEGILDSACLPAIPDTEGLGCWSEGDPFSGVQSDFYFSSTTCAFNPGSAWHALLNGGNVGTNSKANSDRVWPVRGNAWVVPPPPPPCNCCTDHGGLGCDNQVCEDAVCSFDLFCCTDLWDAICADEAQNVVNCGCCP